MTMATAFSTSDTGSVEIKNVLKCVICKSGISSDLIQLDCFHPCHKNCINISPRLDQIGTKFCCTECEYATLIPEEGIDALPEELLQYKMREIAEIYANVAPFCKMCENSGEEKISTHFCITCKFHICSADSKRHELFPNHKVIKNGDVQTEQYLPQILTSKEATCFKHSTASVTEFMKFYCQDCNIPMCQVCNGTDHKPHTAISIQEACQKLQEDLKEKAKQTFDEMHKCELLIDTFDTHLFAIEQTTKRQIEECKKLGEYVKQLVDKNVKYIQVIAQIEKDYVIKVFREIKNKYKQMQIAKDYIDVFQKFASDSDFMQKHKLFTTNLEKCLQREVKDEIQISYFEFGWNNSKDIEKNLEEMLKVETVKESFPLTLAPLTQNDDLEFDREMVARVRNQMELSPTDSDFDWTSTYIDPDLWCELLDPYYEDEIDFPSQYDYDSNDSEDTARE